MPRPVSPHDPYIAWRKRLPAPQPTAGNSALLVVDMQYADASMNHGIMKYKRDNGFHDGLPHFAAALDLIVPNTQRLISAFRSNGIDVIYTRIQSLKKDGRDRSNIHKDLALHAPPGSKEAEILEELAPLDDEMIFNKTTASLFNSTNAHYALQNMGIKNLFMVGVMTSGCVESCARDAKDLGYQVVMIDDACASWTQELHDASLRVLDQVYAVIQTTNEVIAAIKPTSA